MVVIINKLLYLFKKTVYHSIKMILIAVSFLSPRWYMSLYIPLLRWNGLKIYGKPRFISFSAKFDDFNLISINDRLVVSAHVIFLTHDYSYTTALISLNEKPETDIGILRPITIGENVFIGMNSLILPGASIGSNVIIGAGSIVRGHIPDNSVVAGNPAQVITNIKSHAIKMKSKNYLMRVDSK